MENNASIYSGLKKRDINQMAQVQLPLSPSPDSTQPKGTVTKASSKLAPNIQDPGQECK